MLDRVFMVKMVSGIVSARAPSDNVKEDRGVNRGHVSRTRCFFLTIYFSYRIFFK